jgi:hypothetical protein
VACHWLLSPGVLADTFMLGSLEKTRPPCKPCTLKSRNQHPPPLTHTPCETSSQPTVQTLKFFIQNRKQMAVFRGQTRSHGKVPWTVGLKGDPTVGFRLAQERSEHYPEERLRQEEAYWTTSPQGSRGVTRASPTTSAVPPAHSLKNTPVQSLIWVCEITLYWNLSEHGQK